MMILSEIYFFAIIFMKILYMALHDFITAEFDGFRVFQQLVVPASAGGIGGLSLMVMASLSHYGQFSFKDFYKVYLKLAVLGGIAGIAAVNLLNPDGDISQVMILGLIAGLSGFSYLKRNSLVDSIYEDSFLEEMKKTVVTEAENFLGNVEEESEQENEQEDIVDRSESENEEESEYDEPEVEQPDAEKVVQYIDKKVFEWIEKNPNATEEEIIDYYQKITVEVFENPKLIEFEE